VSSSKIIVGTGANKLSQDFTFRFLNFNPLKSSQFSHARVSSKPSKKKELFFFGAIGIDYVASNIFIEGSLFAEGKSALERKALPIIFRQQVGVMYSSTQWSFSATANGLTKEVENGVDHLYGSVEISFRF
jgi:hypothetical protein